VLTMKHPISYVSLVKGSCEGSTSILKSPLLSGSVMWDSRQLATPAFHRRLGGDQRFTTSRSPCSGSDSGGTAAVYRQPTAITRGG
jgi:hypothetical protein